jgi:hypothetical protein
MLKVISLAKLVRKLAITDFFLPKFHLIHLGIKFDMS